MTKHAARRFSLWPPLNAVGLLIPGPFPDLAFEAVAHRSPHDIMEEIAALGAQRADVLVKIKELP